MNLSHIPYATVLMLCLALHASAYEKSYLPLSEKELSSRFLQRTVRERFVPFADVQESARIGSTRVRFLHTNSIQFSGRDSDGKPWTSTAGAGMGGSLYSADLDHNGVADIIYASFTGGNGWAPPMHVLTLMFEANGRPSLSEMDGYFETDARGLKDLLDLDGNGQAELLRQSFDDGYWITSLYEARDARWQIIRGRHASREYPLYTRFTNRVNRVPTTPLPGRHPIEDDLSSGVDPNAPAMTLERVEWADVQQSGDPMLRFSNGRECEMAGWYSSAAVIIDAPGGRSTATLGAPAEARKLLEEIARRRLPTRIAGNRRNRSAPTKVDGKVWCSVEMVWAVNSTQLP